MFLVASLTSFFAPLAVAQVYPAEEFDLDCKAPAGKNVCVAIKTVESFAQPCMGSGCDFPRLIAQMDRATQLYIGLIPETASPQAGALAKSASSALCDTRFTGSGSVIARFIVSANRFLEAMLELQEVANVEEPDTCVFR